MRLRCEYAVLISRPEFTKRNNLRDSIPGLLSMIFFHLSKLDAAERQGSWLPHSVARFGETILAEFLSVKAGLN